MAGKGRAAASDPRDVDELLTLSLSRPREALAGARAMLAGRPGPYEASVAHQAASIVLRDLGDTQAAVAGYEDAARRTTSIPEQRYLRAQAERLRVDVENPPTAPTTG